MLDQTIEDSWEQVSRALASAEEKNQKYRKEQFYKKLQDYRFLPGGCILAGAGTGRKVTLLTVL